MYTIWTHNHHDRNQWTGLVEEKENVMKKHIAKVDRLSTQVEVLEYQIITMQVVVAKTQNQCSLIYEPNIGRRPQSNKQASVEGNIGPSEQWELWSVFFIRLDWTSNNIKDNATLSFGGLIS